MGSLYKRGAKWWAKYQEVDGTTVRKPTGTDSKEIAKKWLAAVEGRVVLGQAGVSEKPKPTGKPLTVRELLAKFLDEYSNPEIHVMKTYRANVRICLGTHVMPYIPADGPAVALTRVDVERARDRAAEKYRNAGVNTGLRYAHVVYEWAIDREIIVCRNPFHKVKHLPQKARQDHYSTDEIHKIVVADAGEFLPFVPVILTTALYCGARRGELFGLTWDDVDLDATPPRFTIRRSFSKQTKTGEERTVPVHRELVSLLRQWKRACPPTATGHVFPVPTEARKMRDGMGWVPHTLAPTAVRRRESRRLRAFLLSLECHAPPYPFHAARHTLVTRATEAGVSPVAFQFVVGHSTGISKVTQGYTHVSLAWIAAEMDKLTLQPPPIAGVTPLRRRA